MIIPVLLAAYMLGSIPSAVLVARWVAGVDIRTVGDGNMGAHNVKRVLGWRPGILVALMDFSKGALAVLLAKALGLDTGWQLIALACAVLGHDFPVFAGFRGGQGLASTLGGLFAIATLEMLIGLTVYGLLYLITRNANLGAGAGTGLGVLLMALWGRPLPLVLGAIAIILTIPAKMLLDHPRREAIRQRYSE